MIEEGKSNLAAYSIAVNHDRIMNESDLFPLAPHFAKIFRAVNKPEESLPYKIRPKTAMQLQNVEPLCRRDQETIDTIKIEAKVSNERKAFMKNQFTGDLNFSSI